MCYDIITIFYLYDALYKLLLRLLKPRDNFLKATSQRFRHSQASAVIVEYL